RTGASVRERRTHDVASRQARRTRASRAGRYGARVVKLWLVTIRLALRSLRRNPLRSSLTSLGVIVGVAAVISMVSLGQGARAALQEQIASVGTNMVMIFPGTTTTAGARAGWGSGKRLTVADARAIERQVEGLSG